MFVAIALLASLAHAAKVEPASVTASSYYAEGDATYPASGIKDGKVASAWFEGAAGSGQGESVTLDFGAEKSLTRIVVYPGQWENYDSWGKANRPKEVELKYSDGSTELWTLEDAMSPQVKTFAAPKKTSSVTVKIKQIYNGSVFHDTGISEIQVFDDSPDKGATITGVTASTTFSGDDGTSYAPTTAADGLKDTFWCEGNKTSDGTGEWIELRFANKLPVSKLQILNGMGSSADLHKRGNAATGATLKFSDGSSQDVTLKALFLPQTVPFPVRTTDSVRITFTGVRAGTDFNDLCVSEVALLP